MCSKLLFISKRLRATNDQSLKHKDWKSNMGFGPNVAPGCSSEATSSFLRKYFLAADIPGGPAASCREKHS